MPTHTNASVDTDTMSISRSLFQSPARISVAAFGVLIALGTSALMLPAATADRSLGFVDALFTATSAACVTGLVVRDTAHAFSPFGQVVILALIQVGGLGIMTLSTLMLLMAGRRPGLAGRLVVTDTFTLSGDRSLVSVLRDVVVFTGVIEAAGAAVLFIRFLPGNDTARALYLSCFHSVSAFCNAGFALFPDSFAGYREDWVVNLDICLLIICGGIGFLVLSELKRTRPLTGRKASALSLHSKVVLSTTAGLLLAGTVGVLCMEWNNTLAPLGVPGRFLAAFFHSASARTAGFNTLPLGQMANETLFFTVMLMFIGASPGSCGGGIKTTTFATIVSMGISRLRGHERPRMFRRSLAPGGAARAVSVVILAAVVVAAGTMALLMTELGETPHSLSRGKFLELLFEVVSAFGTVGLSMGVTAGLSTAGKLIVAWIMFVGRLGPLVVAMAVSRQAAPRYYYAEEHIMVG